MRLARNALKCVIAALLNQVRVEWQATSATSGGGGVSRQRKRSTTAAEVAGSDIHSAVAPVTTAAPSYGLGALMHISPSHALCQRTLLHLE